MGTLHSRDAHGKPDISSVDELTADARSTIQRVMDLEHRVELLDARIAALKELPADLGEELDRRFTAHVSRYHDPLDVEHRLRTLEDERRDAS